MFINLRFALCLSISTQQGEDTLRPALSLLGDTQLEQVEQKAIGSGIKDAQIIGARIGILKVEIIGTIQHASECNSTASSPLYLRLFVSCHEMRFGLLAGQRSRQGC